MIRKFVMGSIAAAAVAGTATAANAGVQVGIGVGVPGVYGGYYPGYYAPPPPPPAYYGAGYGYGGYGAYGGYYGPSCQRVVVGYRNKQVWNGYAWGWAQKPVYRTVCN